jgi:hypothetical protein
MMMAEVWGSGKLMRSTELVGAPQCSALASIRPLGDYLAIKTRTALTGGR